MFGEEGSSIYIDNRVKWPMQNNNRTVKPQEAVGKQARKLNHRLFDQKLRNEHKIDKKINGNFV
jgi:hypothetical protein